ncbi:MAG: hypothetical protein AVO35_05770 [Candidatus Aegiribacteria sp. MLS_C]|nr:MAG: hypothetical protein AVO35_05770 [Candidatus Aegiribacteria sp. MLS_C]
MGISPKGIHHFVREGHRLHLRSDGSGTGMLTVDASRIVHLNSVAVDMAWMILSGYSDREAVGLMVRTYRVGRKRASSDLMKFGKVLAELILAGEKEPVSFENIDVREPFRTKVSVPYRMDLALTYRCNLNCGHCYNQSREKTELGTDGWKEVLKRIWDLGIPHAIFTGGEATLRKDLPELVGFAESLGMVTGLLTNGVRLADAGYLNELVLSGLDHVQITLESSNEDIHNSMTGSDSFRSTVKAIRNCVDAGIHTITNTTVTKVNREGLPDTVEFVHGLGLGAVAANAVIHSGRALEGDWSVTPEDLEITMLRLTETLDRLGMRFVWYSPTRYCSFNPLEFSLGPRRCTAGEYNLCIEPDGEVLPCQSWYESAGNFLEDDWDSIWNGPLLRYARDREWVDDECRDCVHFDLCGGGCPLEKQNGVPCRDSM